MVNDTQADQQDSIDTNDIDILKRLFITFVDKIGVDFF